MDNSRHILQVYVGALSPQYEALSVEASKKTTSDEIVSCICDRLQLQRPGNYELAEVIGNAGGQECKERRLGRGEHPVAVQMLWPKSSMTSSTTGNIPVNAVSVEFQAPEYRFCLREKSDVAGSSMSSQSWLEGTDPQLIRDYFLRFLYQPKDKEYPDLCQLPDLNESSLLENLKARFHNGHIYTYVGSILIALNPFKFYPIYNPKYVKLYQNRRLGELPPHIFAVADAAYHTMLRDRSNQCIVISGESGSGKTESTNLLLHHLTALSQKGTYGSGVEQTILSAGPVLEAFGNAKTAHNNNSSRFGKFIQVNYKENGMVHGALVQKYLLEKSRIVSQAKKERNYHVFYYLLAGANEDERAALKLLRPQEYHYLNQSASYTLEGVDETYEFLRLKQSMEMVGFPTEKQRRLFAVLSAVLHLGNIEFVKKSMYHHDEAVLVKNPDLVTVISSLLKVKEETLMMALTTKKARVSGETLVINYRLPEAIAARDALAKCLYGALFDWIVLQVNHALLSKKDSKQHSGHSIGVLDIFGFEDFGVHNSFEQFCINFANEHLQYYFNQHVFKYEQEEYKREGIRWKIIEFLDNTGCLSLIEGKPNGLLCILDDQCNFPGATNDTLLQKYNSEHKDNEFYDYPQRRDHAFVIKHYAGKVKYNVKDFREKNLDSIRHDIVSVLKNSSMVFVRELVGSDPVAVFRWAILRAFIKATFAFQEAGRRCRTDQSDHFAKRNQIASKKHNPSDKSHWSGYRRQSSSSTGSGRSITSSGHNNRVDSDGGRIGNGVCSGGNNADDVMFNCDLGSNMQRLEGILGANDARAIQRATKILQKNKNSRPRHRNCKGLKNLQSVKTLAGKTQGGNAPNRAVRKQPPTVTAQFQISLIHLMETLNDASPFFVRCIKSNSEKVPNKFDEDIVLRQLRYTGMLETVRIRQSGYNVRLTFDEFIQVYRILLPKGLLSSQNDVRSFLLTMNLNRDNYQIGKTKIFLRESEKLKLDLRLHQAILDRIVTIQRWYRVVLERRAFLRLKSVVVGLQSYSRRYLTQKWFARLREQWEAAVHIQAQWRGYQARTRYQQFRRGVVFLQSCLRGHSARRRFLEIQNSRRIQEEEEHEKLRLLKLRREQEQKDQQQSQQQADRQLEIDRKMEINRREQLDRRIEILQDRRLEVRKDLRLDVQNEQQPVKQHIEQHHRIVVAVTQRRPSNSRVAAAGDVVVDGFSSSQSDEAFLSKESSQEELENDRLYVADNLIVNQDPRDSEESSGIHEDSETESMLSEPPVPVEEKPPELPPRAVTSTVAVVHQQSISSSPISSKSSIGSPTSPTILVYPDIQQKTKSNNNVEKTSHSNFEEIIKRPIRKLSIKRSKSARASLGGDIQPPPVPIRHNKEERQGSKGHVILDITKEPEHALKGSSRTTDEIPINRNPFHRAKKHLKGAIEFLGKKNKNLPGGEESGDESGCDDSSVVAKDSFEESPEQSPIELAYIPEKFEVVTTPSPTTPDKILFTSTFTPASSQRQHNFKTVNKFAKSEICITCEKNMATFFSQGYRCTDCRAAAHPRCVQQANKWECNRRSPPSHRKDSRRPTITRIDLPPSGNWNVTCRKEYSDRADKVVSDVMELKLMDEFISKKIFQMDESGGKRDTVADVVFKRALREFKAYLISTYSVLAKEGRLSLRYKDLIGTFESTMENVCRQEQSATFPVTLGVNAFRGFLNEFVTEQQRIEEKPKTKVKKEKRKKGENFTNCLGHTFVLVAVNIPTACEICTSFMWLMEKSLVCQKCKLTCHKKCCSKITMLCKDDQETPPYAFVQGGRIFGVRLQNLVNEDLKVPVIVDRLITTIEIKGLYTEGIYRKSGSSSKVRALRQDIENDVDKVDYDEYPVHVLTTTLKAFFREMPEPVLTFEAYDQFIRATDVSDPVERVSTIFTLIDKLPKNNYNLVERLVFHLARVAQQEQSNLMSASSLAIVFAPCVLRTSKNVNAQDSLNDIAKQTMCVESIIVEQLTKLRTTLADIDTLDMVCHKASNRLSSLRSSKTCLAQDNAQFQSDAHNDVAVEEKILTHQIESLKNEKALLTTVLPTLKRTCSDEDMLSVDMGSSVSSVDEVPHHHHHHGHEEYAVTFDLPVTPASSLNHLTKSRVNPPRRRRRPSKLANITPRGKPSTLSSTVAVYNQPSELVTFKDDAIMV